MEQDLLVGEEGENDSQGGAEAQESSCDGSDGAKASSSSSSSSEWPSAKKSE